MEPNSQTFATLTKGDLLLSRFFFFLCGAAGLQFGNAILNSIFPLFNILYKNPLAGDTVIIAFFVSFSIGAAFFMLWPRISLLFMGLSILGSVCCIIFFGLTVQHTNDWVGIVVIHIVVSASGFFSSIFVTAGFVLAAISPAVFAGYVVAGMGFSGICAFSLFQLLNSSFDILDISQLRLLIWLFHGLCGIFAPLFMIVLFFLQRREWVRICVKEFNNEKLTSTVFNSEDGNVSTYQNPARPKRVLIRQALKMLSICSISYICTFSVYPQVGPFTWKVRRVTDASLLVGVYQSFDFAGRYLPNFGTFFHLKQRTLMFVAPLRFLFIPTFLVFSLVPDPIFGNIFLQIGVMAIFAISHGYSVSLSLMEVPHSAKSTREKGLLGVVSSFWQMSSAAISLILSKLMKIAILQ